MMAAAAVMTRPVAAPIDSRFMTAAFRGMATLRLSGAPGL
jgi:hypothetical protein